MAVSCCTAASNASSSFFQHFVDIPAFFDGFDNGIDSSELHSTLVCSGHNDVSQLLSKFDGLLCRDEDFPAVDQLQFNNHTERRDDGIAGLYRIVEFEQFLYASSINH